MERVWTSVVLVFGFTESFSCTCTFLIFLFVRYPFLRMMCRYDCTRGLVAGYKNSHSTVFQIFVCTSLLMVIAFTTL